VGKADVGQLAGDGVDRRRTHVERLRGAGGSGLSPW
jgi:hypothetical protein